MKSAFYAQAAAKAPLGRTGTADEMAHAVLYFADAVKSGFTTGANLLIDGGLTVKGAMA